MLLGIRKYTNRNAVQEAKKERRREGKSARERETKQEIPTVEALNGFYSTH